MDSTQDLRLHGKADTSVLGWRDSHLIEQFISRFVALIWRWGQDRQSVMAFIGRYSAHAAVLALAILVGVLGRVSFASVSEAQSPDPLAGFQPAAAEPIATPTAPSDTAVARPTDAQKARAAVVRQVLPQTIIPDRVRLEVITYTVQSGDNIFLIAEQFGLSAYTIAWANMETLQGSPWLIQPGLTLFIPPVDGVYHTVADGETLDGIAEQFEVSVDALYNVWNPTFAGGALAEGLQLVIPGGIGEDIEWEAPPPEPTAPGVSAAAASWGACGDVTVSGPGATGWFIWPTGSTAVSGWTFGDPRNPGHIGLDYRCRLGDPIYAADNGVVVFAGWGGGYGNLVRVRHGNGYETYYAHFSAFAVGCGEPVYQGQIVGYCGSTGWSTGPHLHYEIRFNGVPLNPRLFE